MKKTLETIDNMLSICSRNEIHKGLLVCIIHYWTYALFILYLLFGPCDKLYYFIVLLIIATYISNLYFRGCILLKIERNYFNKSWKGVFHSLEVIKIYPTDSDIRQYYAPYLIYMYAGIISSRLFLSF